MRLRKQLLFLSLVTLALPWVGCQYIREMDSTLRQGQADALSATARAVSSRISSDTELLTPFEAYAPLFSPLYAHPLRQSIVVDGYYDDWFASGFRFTPLPSNPKHKVLMGIWKSQLYVMLQVQTPSFKYFTPAKTTLKNVDFIQLNMRGKSIGLYAGAPGRLKALNLDKNLTVDLKQAEYQIKGHWLEWENGYRVEFSVPLNWTQQGFALQVNNALTYNAESPDPMPIVQHSHRLAKELSIFASEDVRLHLVTKSTHKIGNAGRINLLAQNERQHGFLEWLYNLALGNRQFPSLNTNIDRGVFDSTDVDEALKGEITQSWYQLNSHNIARVSVPIFNKSHTIVGAIVAEQSTDTLSNVTNNAFSRLLAYSFLASTFAGLCLVLYATWLSIRIRKLSHAAANAINESGKISESFPVSDSADEIGELSRSYAHLLTRLREYTNYLRTLSSKLSHELRTPLAIVRSSLDNLEHEKLTKQARVYADRAREGTTRLSNILNSMSAASRVEQAIGSAEREHIPCDQLISSLKDAYEDVYKHVEFKLNIRPDPKGLKIWGAGELLVQAFDKLVDNAADFCPQGGQIELGLYRHQNDVIFTVRNEGPPLPSHMHGQLFDSMVSVRETASKENDHHLGLGLYIVRLITDFHHGEVQGYNVPDNSGVIFEVRLPCDPPLH